ncbi:MAG: hypothetical protein LN568_01465 [Rickettsia endosymbiont of Pseudomimeciton antennatum]|nr:hypothetical protein [Rickettsia endosymbiont of Pseudomimeciton antennatum]
MLIAQNRCACNSARQVIINISQLTSNIVPSNGHHQLLHPCGKLDTTAGSILSVLIFLYRHNGNSKFQLIFSYFKDKVNFGILQLKDAVIRLEQTKLVLSSFRTVMAYGRKSANELLLILLIGNVLKLTNDHQTKEFPMNDGNGFIRS